MDLFKLSGYCSQVSILIPIIFFLLRKENFKNQNLSILGILLFTSILFDGIGYLSARLYHSNIIVVNIYFPIQFLLLSWMYWRLYENTNRQFIKIGVIIFIMVFIINTLFGQGLYVLQNISLSASSLILGTISLRFFKVTHHLPVNTKGKDSNFNSLFCINVAVFLYFSLNFCLFTISPAMMEFFNEQGAVNLWAFHNAGNILKNLLFAVGIYWAGVKG